MAEEQNICTECGYEGHEGPGEGTCPECGGDMETQADWNADEDIDDDDDLSDLDEYTNWAEDDEEDDL